MFAPPNTPAAPPPPGDYPDGLLQRQLWRRRTTFQFLAWRLRCPRHSHRSAFSPAAGPWRRAASRCAASAGRDRLENLRGQIDSDVRVALFNLESASQQVAVAQSNIDLAEQSLTQSRDRFAAGVTDTVEVVQAQEAVATAHQSYISSLYSYNYAKISLARAMGAAEQGVKEYFKGK